MFKLIKKFLMYKFGAPASTARTLIKGYRIIKNKWPNLTEQEVFLKILEVRYFDKTDELSKQFKVQLANSCNSLFELTMAVVKIDSKDFNTLPLSIQQEFIESIELVFNVNNIEV